MTEKARFSSTHGENIVLSNSSATAKWSPKQFGGWVSSLMPLEHGQTVVGEFDGSGHCELGLFKHDPNHTSPTKQSFIKINEIRIHKKKCCIPVTLNDRGTEVSSRFQEKTFTASFEQDTRPWLAIIVKFGKISARLLLNGSPQNHIRFSKNHGENIILGDDNCIASAVKLSPSSSCFVKERLTAGEELIFKCAPILDGDREPSRFQVKLDAYERNPESLKKDFKHLFQSGPVGTSEPPTTTLEVFEKDDCKGEIVVSLRNSSTIGYKAASSKYNEQTLRVPSDGVWIILELYRTYVTVTKRNSQSSKTGTDVVDAVVREPSNIDSENSVDPFLSHQERTQVKRQVSDYTEVTGVKTPDESSTNSTDRRLAALERGQSLLQGNVEELTQLLKTTTEFQNASLHSRAKGVLSAPKALPNGTSSNVKDREINVRQNFTTLIRDMHCIPLSDKLFEKEIITLNEYHEITTEATAAAGNRKLLIIISKKRVMKTTMDLILEDIEQGHLKDLF